MLRCPVRFSGKVAISNILLLIRIIRSLLPYWFCLPIYSEELPEDVFLCFYFWIFVPVFTVVIVQFDSFQYHLYFQWSFDEFVLYFRIVFCGFNFVSNFFGCQSVEHALFFDIHDFFFQYSSRVLLSFCLILKNWALLWNTFFMGKHVFLNNFSSSCRLMSFSSLLHRPLNISCFAFGSNAQMTSPLM